ncbi:hypothetical protein [Kitasatospora sp. NPDC001175]|uniref:hypothetical protein n=1 Tax=Kitasatospora sp. NPDC001175 TaxID=3157103 RepID=UPI003D0253BB
MNTLAARCTHYIGAERRHCHNEQGVRAYLPGTRCPLHTPAAVAGRPEPPEGEGPLPGAWSTPSPQSASALIDHRAIASGKRRSNPTDYQAARAAVNRSST